MRTGESPALKNPLNLLTRAAGALTIAAVILSGCGEGHTQAAPHRQTEARVLAQCDLLTVVNQNGLIKAHTNYTLAGGAEYVGTVYVPTINGKNQVSISVPVQQSPDGSLTYHLPQKPAVQHDELTAVIDYSVAGKPGVDGTVPGPACQVSLDYQP